MFPKTRKMSTDSLETISFTHKVCVNLIVVAHKSWAMVMLIVVCSLATYFFLKKTRLDTIYRNLYGGIEMGE